MNWDRFFSQTSRALAAKVREAVALPSSEAARLPSTGLEGDTPVTVECYGKVEKWNSRYLAFHYYSTGALQCDGSEAERYTFISGGLLLGHDKVNDQFLS